MHIFHFIRCWQVALQSGSTSSHMYQQWKESACFLTSCQPLTLANQFWQSDWGKLLSCFSFHFSGNQWGRASFHDHRLLVFAPSWQMSFYPCVTTSVLKSTLSFSLQKSSVLWPSLQGLCQACGSLQVFAICSRDWETPPRGRRGIPVTLYRPRETSDLRRLQTCRRCPLPHS